jgi:phosphoglycolate phosphatase
LQGLPKAVHELFPGFSEQQTFAMVERAERMILQERNKVFVFPGIRMLLQQLQYSGIACALASNKSQLSLQNALETSELQNYFKVVRSAGNLPAKPNPQMLLEIMDIYQINPSEVVMVGDSFADVEMAKSIHVDAIAVDWYASGVWHPDRMGAKAVVNTIEHLSALLGIQLSSGEKIEQGV